MRTRALSIGQRGIVQAVVILLLAALALVALPGSAGASSSFIAYQVPAGTAASNPFSGALGMDFNVNSPVTITHLGAFDSGSDGLSRPISVRLYDRATQTSVASVSFPVGNSGTLIGGSRFLPLASPITLAAGFQGTIVAAGYGPDEPNGNAAVCGLSCAWTTNDGGGALSFVGGGRFGFDANGFPTNVDGGPANRYAAGTFQAETVAATASACAPNVAEASQYSLVYELPIPANGSNYASSSPQYTVDNSATVGSFNRIAYCLQLNNDWVWVSMDAFTTVRSKTGVPTFGSGAIFQQYVSNMNVASNNPGVVTGTGITGNIEFWPNNYHPFNALAIPGASNSRFDFGDTRHTSGQYGSMQVHDYGAQQTIFAYNNWGGGGTTDLGIGSSSGPHFDWTFRNNANTYSVRNLKVYVGQVQADLTPPTVTPTVTGTLGDNGWYTSNVGVTWTVTDAESAVTSTSGCGPQSVTSDTAGVPFTCSATSAGGSASTSVTIKRDATAPSISGAANPAPNGNGWNNSDVTVSFTCTDALSGVAGCTPATTLSTEGAGQSVTGTATDQAGNTASATVSGINIDKTAPSASAAITAGTPGTNGWYVSPVTVSSTCTDALSGVASAPGAVTLSADGAGQGASGTCVDQAGNSAGASVSGIDIDQTAPAASYTISPATPDGNNGWYVTSPTVSFSGTDATSGIAACSPSVSLGDGPAQSATGSCTDNAGNTSPAVTSAPVQVDTTAPSAGITGVSNGATYVLGAVPTAGLGCTDATSGVASSSDGLTGGNANGVGSFTYSVTCTDTAGNATTATATYSVVYAFGGFVQPIPLPVSTFKAGSTIPVKFVVEDANGATVTTAVATVSVNGGPALGTAKYTDGKYLFNLRTKGLPTGALTITVTLDDGTSHSVVVTLK